MDRKSTFSILLIRLHNKWPYGDYLILLCCGTWTTLVDIAACLPLLWVGLSNRHSSVIGFQCPRTGAFRTHGKTAEGVLLFIRIFSEASSSSVQSFKSMIDRHRPAQQISTVGAATAVVALRRYSTRMVEHVSSVDTEREASTGQA